MLDNPPETPAVSVSTNPNAKRYVPPNQRNRGRKSGDHRSVSASVSDAETSRSIAHPPPQLVPLSGCSSSDAFRLLRQRWEAAINGCRDPSLASSDRPIVYSGSLEIPHQVMFGAHNLVLENRGETRRENE